MGWLLAELEQRFGYGLEELARRFDRSVSWVSRRLALVECLPEAIQQQVREGKIPAQVALKFLVPVARQSLEDCQRMAAAFAQQHCDTREAGQLHAAYGADDDKAHPAISVLYSVPVTLTNHYWVTSDERRRMIGYVTRSMRQFNQRSVQALIDQELHCHPARARPCRVARIGFRFAQGREAGRPRRGKAWT